MLGFEATPNLEEFHKNTYFFDSHTHVSCASSLLVEPSKTMACDLNPIP